MAKGKKKKAPTEKKYDTPTIPLSALDYEDKPIEINKWDGGTLKNTLDDAVHKYVLDEIEDHEYQELHDETDLKLVMCTIACIFAGVACVYGFVTPHPESTPVVSICVLGYFVFVSTLTAWSAVYETQSLLRASTPADDEGQKKNIVVNTFMQRYGVQYTVEINYSDGLGGSSQVFEDWHVQEFFYDNGEFSHTTMEERIAGMVQDLWNKAPEDSKKTQ